MEDAQVADARQDTIELLECSCETFSQRFNKGVGVDRFAQLLVMQRAAILLAPIAGQIVARIAERMGAFHPNFLAFQRPFQFFKHAQFVVASVNLDFVFDLLEHFLVPLGSDDSLNWHRPWEALVVRV